MAISEAITADYNATVAVAHDPKTGDLYLRDMIRVRGWDKFRPILKTAMLDSNEKEVTWGLEKVAFQSLAFKELMRDRELVKVAITEVVPQGNKLTRALPLQYRAKSGHVKLVEGGWVNGFLDEAVMLTGQGRGHDDQVDSASGGMQMIGTAVHHESRIL
jgi:predicted phage terminase large subunit-like protein